MRQRDCEEVRQAAYERFIDLQRKPQEKLTREEREFFDNYRLRIRYQL